MTYSIPSTVEMWEAVIAVAALQSCYRKGPVPSVEVGEGAAPDLNLLMRYAGFPASRDSELLPLDFTTPYRRADAYRGSYLELFAEVNQLKTDTYGSPRLPVFVPPPVGTHIVVAPFAFRKDVCLPISVWRAIIRHLRSYGHPVYLIGNREQRMDSAGFTEGELYGRRTFYEKMHVLSTAQLVVGVPNEWLWLSSAYEDRTYPNLIVLYPEDEHPKKWFPWAAPNYGRILYQPHTLQIPVMLAALRQLIARLP